jgi:hypothetical protein
MQIFVETKGGWVFPQILPAVIPAKLQHLIVDGGNLQKSRS